MALEGTKIALLVEDEYEEMEFWYPLLRLREAGADVRIIGTERGQVCHGKHGYPVTAEAAAHKVAAKEFDAIVVPGGYAPDHMRRNPAMIQLVRDMNDQGKLVAAICHGPWMLISAEVLGNRRATCFHSVRDDVINAGAEYINQEVVVDDNIVTSRNVDDLPAFCREIIRYLEEAEVRVKRPKEKAA